jgi:hypothetical protein
MSSFLILPTSLEVTSLTTSLITSGGIWTQDWNGELQPIRLVILLIQFFILAAGFIGLFRMNKSIAIIFILLFVSVLTANALGRTSGGRYIVPVDWLVLIIYSAGILYLIGKLDIHTGTIDKGHGRIIIGKKQLIITIVFILLIGSLPVIFENITSAVIPHEEKILTVGEVGKLLGTGNSDQGLNELSQFLDGKKTELIQGFVFFPTQKRLRAMDNIPTILQRMDQDIYMVSFELIQPKGEWTVYFPYRKGVKIHNTDRIILVGCDVKNAILAHDLILIQNDKTIVYQSELHFDSCNPVITR